MARCACSQSRRNMDITKLNAIDVHTHAETSRAHPERKHPFAEAAGAYFGQGASPNAWEVAAYYRGLAIAAVIFPVDMELKTAQERVPNDEILQAARENPDILIPFASIHPA